MVPLFLLTAAKCSSIAIPWVGCVRRIAGLRLTPGFALFASWRSVRKMRKSKGLRDFAE